MSRLKNIPVAGGGEGRRRILFALLGGAFVVFALVLAVMAGKRPQARAPANLPEQEPVVADAPGDPAAGDVDGALAESEPEEEEPAPADEGMPDALEEDADPVAEESAGDGGPSPVVAADEPAPVAKETEEETDPAVAAVDQRDNEALQRALKRIAFLENLERSGSRMEAALVNEKAELTQLVQTLRQNLRNREIVISRQGTALKRAQKNMELVKGLRQQLAADLAGEMASRGIDGVINPNTGAFVMRMDEALYFRKGSYRLTREAKKTLREVIPVYGKILMANPVRQKITGLRITGHASPFFRGKYADPIQDNAGFRYNMRLSLRRAMEITSWIYGPKGPRFEHKDKLRRLTRVVGKGYMEPVPLLSDEEADGNPCGPWDCRASRRVVIEFELLSEDHISDRMENLGIMLTH